MDGQAQVKHQMNHSVSLGQNYWDKYLQKPVLIWDMTVVWCPVQSTLMLKSAGVVWIYFQALA